MRRFFRVITYLLLMCGCCAAEKTPEFFEAPKQITVTFTGDCTLGCDPRERGKETGFEAYIAQYGYEYPFAQVKALFEQDDITVINLEGTFFDSDSGKTKKTYNFRGPTDFARILPLSSVEAVSLGNNHTMDYGRAGFESTVAALEENQINWFATTECSDQTWIYEKDNMKIGFVSVNSNYWWREGSKLKVKQQLETLREAGCRPIIACMHCGIEYAQLHDTTQEKMADVLMQYGVDVVVGNHPHVIQGMRVQNGKTVLWSLGNFSFGGNSQVRSLQALVARVTFSFDQNGQYLGHQVNLLPVHVSGHSDYNDYQPVFVTDADAKKAIDALQSDSSPKGSVAPYVENAGALQSFVPAP